jgi:uncharacterized membrane protein
MSILQMYFSFHMIGLVIWLGAAMVLPIALIPALKSLDDAGQAKFMGIFTKRYIPWFIIAGLVVGVTGLLQTIHPELAEEMADNAFLILKHSFILPLIAASVYVWFVLARKLGKLEQDWAHLMQQFIIFSWVQAVLSVAVLIITGILTG